MAKVILKELTKIFKKGKALIYAANKVSLEVNDGESFGILGPSGGGKTTLLRLIAGLEVPTDGYIYFDNVMVSAPNKVIIDPADRGIAMVFQNWALYPNMTIFDNIAFPLRNQKVPKAEISKKVNEVAEILNIKNVLDHYPREVSGGQMQRAALARALVKNPKLLLLDEPFSNLDAQIRDSARALVKKIQKELKLTTIIVSHDPADIFSIAEQVGVIFNGILVQKGNASEIYDNPVNVTVSRLLGDINIIKAEINNNAINLGNIIIPINNRKIEKQVVYIGIRPEDIRISDSNEIPEFVNVGKVKVKVTSYVAGIFKAVVSPINDESIEFDVNTERHIKAGTEMNLFVRTNKIKIFDEKGNKI
ncbi:ATPase component of ABC-type sugar transporter [Caldisphaera lagunensis DSM 15908]|uniref:ATPase component of ABC-type sugar transporter n=1 Tax=Caldisphaera lagunensis (strain DSM 15908 / JCM 11604 / ANMR 0165 / IC-154) TaxID=1056495 RepID=L0A9W3_CALLD|nr:glucose ABC transporter ATP-binding protein GlcV [Caldisphaera lagunensis]AFZ70683.1 ATPase component of ABC-type sugar transporter [Caldisphaera lagunensis DSM 15908]